MKKPILMIVGRPNVGKSCLFNRIVRKRSAVVDDMSGVTRDRNYASAEWGAVRFLVADTGGVMPPSDDRIAESIREQVEMGIADADAIVFLTDASIGPTDFDLYIAKLLRREAADKVVVAANKSESPSIRNEAASFISMGLGDPVPISALHGHGTADLLDRICEIFSHAKPRERSEQHEDSVKVAILGRPNVGKSSITNRLLGTNRMIVHDMAGTTRDAIDSYVTFHGRHVTLIDTAGLRKKSHVKDRVEYYANLRALDSIKRADICVLVVDAEEGLGEQDVRILRQMDAAHRGIILCLNKWDLVSKTDKTLHKIEVDLRDRFMQLKHVPILSVSALSGQRIPSILENAIAIRDRMHQKVSASQFKTVLRDWTTRNPHPMVSGKPVKILGGTQIPADFPLFFIFAGNHTLVKPSYERFLAHAIQDEFGFAGCPVVLSFRPVTASTKTPRPSVRNRRKPRGDSE